MKANCLIIGNGINRPYTDQSWNRIVDELAKNRGIIRDCASIPLPLEFERIMNLHMKNKRGINTQNAYSKAKIYVADKVKGITLPTGAIHNDLVTLPINSIITTNYDFLLESVYGVTSPNANCVGKRSYISGCTSSSSTGTEFYHPHGVISNPSTICLGYVNYVKTCSDLQHVIATKKNNKNAEMCILRHLNGTDIIPDYWGTKLYDSNCAFIGFGLDTCEIDFWWILSHRASIYNQKIGEADALINNTIVYYDIVDKSADYRKPDENLEQFLMRQFQAENEKKKRLEKYKLLESMDVIVKTVEISRVDLFIDAYKKVIEDIKTYGIDRNIRLIVL